ncbi:hypothetical protein H4R34_000027 [Dimargaris verticillata]|uniref:NADH dehydrogenase [ubiquinone] 1 beta subcomplex subunit 9 n=1 Tax=Dimargaris verticillata TaxID=2761393 RepID=A0A9W8B8X5_9FUNG|nr:hypothetical protein H4R34_000027 [Dimargaris verticillata]
MTPHARRVCSLYRKALRTSLDWIVVRDTWRQAACFIRLRIEENRHVTDPKIAKQLTDNFAKELEHYTHPDPFIAPASPGGNLWERNKLWDNAPPKELLK